VRSLLLLDAGRVRGQQREERAPRGWPETWIECARSAERDAAACLITNHVGRAPPTMLGITSSVPWWRCQYCTASFSYNNNTLRVRNQLLVPGGTGARSGKRCCRCCTLGSLRYGRGGLWGLTRAVWQRAEGRRHEVVEDLDGVRGSAGRDARTACLILNHTSCTSCVLCALSVPYESRNGVVRYENSRLLDYLLAEVWSRRPAP
jgi:hypothetical protein